MSQAALRQEMDWLGLIALAISLLVPLALFLGKNWIKAWIERGVAQQLRSEDREPSL